MLTILSPLARTAAENMEKDRQLLSSLDPVGTPILHLYRWSHPLPATCGHFSKPSRFLRPGAPVDLARRPTGGGIVFHSCDLAFSFLMPARHPLCFPTTLDNYRFVNEAVASAVSTLFAPPSGDPGSMEIIPQDFPSLGAEASHFCMAKPTVYDVVADGRKVAGAAQRRTAQGYLHQGTISLAFPDLPLLASYLISPDLLVSAFANYTFAPLGRAPSPAALEEARAALEETLGRKLLEKISERAYNLSS